MKTKCSCEVKKNDEILTNIDKYATDFSEGDSLLEKVLKLLWNEGFETIGCCKGHQEKNTKPYIGIKITSKEKILNLLSSLDKNDIHISFVSSKGRISCGIKKNKEENIFENILKFYNRIDVEEDKILKEIINEILSRKYTEYLNIHCIYAECRKPKIYINVMDLDLIEKYKQQGYEYKVLNKKIHLYRFKIKY